MFQLNKVGRTQCRGFGSRLINRVKVLRIYKISHVREHAIKNFDCRLDRLQSCSAWLKIQFNIINNLANLIRRYVQIKRLKETLQHLTRFFPILGSDADLFDIPGPEHIPIIIIIGC